jgi:hypothetical protein
MSEHEGNRLTLEGLAQKLETQAQRLKTLERENAELRHKVATLEGSETRRDDVVALRGSDRSRAKEVASEFAGQVSRRSLLSKAGAAAVAAVAAGTLLNQREAKAHDVTTDIDVDSVNAHRVIVFPDDNSSAITSTINSRNSAAVKGTNLADGPAIEGVSGFGNGPGIRGSGDPGVFGSGGGGTGAGVLGVNSIGTGVQGEGQAGVVGKSSTTGFEGVYGQHTGSLGFGIVGDGTGAAGAGMLGRNSVGNGVHGQGRYGGKFEGTRAQLLLQPKTTAGRPTSGTHVKGEIYLDSAGTVFVCTAGGTPGTWRRVNTTAVT